MSPFSTYLSAALLLISSASQAAQTTVSFLSERGSSVHLSDALDGAVIPDHLGGNDYNDFVGEMFLMPSDPGILAGLDEGTRGLASSNPGGLFEGRRGFVGFCIDSETAFQTSSSLTETYEYLPLSFEAAEARYEAESVGYYLAGGLKKAAYLMETFFDTAHQGGGLEAGALQIAIWGSLYDSSPDVSTNSGNYYIRNNVGSSQTQQQSDDLINLVNAWYDQAEAADWGGSTYDPNESVVFWMDPTSASTNQSIITLRADESLLPVPEPGVALVGSLTLLLSLGRRRR